jgi:rhodanese-related sulfurtransferase
VLGRVITFDARKLEFGGFSFAGTPEPASAVPFIAPEEVTADDLVIDLRGADEAPQTFAGGRRVPVDHVAALAAEPPPAGRIVLCCRSGQRALIAADALRGQGVARLALVALG